jgi:hypothetical protein
MKSQLRASGKILPLDEDHPDVRDYAATLNDLTSVGLSISEEMGSSVYLDTKKMKESNKVL